MKQSAPTIPFKTILFYITASILVLFSLLFVPSIAEAATDPCVPFRATLTREAQAIYGINAPIPALAGQARQESGCRANVTAWDLGRGLYQFMDATTAQVTKSFPELGAPDPYNPKWAIRAVVRYDGWIKARVKGQDECQLWAGTFKGFNAGPGYVMKAEKKSPDSGEWFGVTEYIPSGQSEKNFEYSRLYPRWILFKHQMKFLDWGHVLCDVKNPPPERK